MKIDVKQFSSLEKIFADEAPAANEFSSALCLKGEKFNYQLSCFVDFDGKEWTNFANVHLCINSDLKNNLNLYSVNNVPVRVPAWNGNDDYFIKKTPGLYPDLLLPVKNEFKVVNKQWRSLWVEVDVPMDAKPGNHSIEIMFFCRGRYINYVANF